MCPISEFSQDEKEKNLDAIASNNLKEGKRDFAGYYQIPYQTLIEMVIYIDEKTRVKSQDMKEAAKNLDASAFPNGEYSFYHSNFEDGIEDFPFQGFSLISDGEVRDCLLANALK